ncbi:hypothetical protein ACTXT7_016446 [Hymenolepis weldensis]
MTLYAFPKVLFIRILHDKAAEVSLCPYDSKPLSVMPKPVYQFSPFYDLPLPFLSHAFLIELLLRVRLKSVFGPWQPIPYSKEYLND